MRRRIRRSRHRLFRLAPWRLRLVFWGGALATGAVSAGFALAGEGADHLFRTLRAAWPWAPVVLLPGGFALIAWITARWFPAARGSGIPQAIACLQVETTHSLRDQALALRVAAAKLVLTLVGLLCGASIGREGPTVHIGAALMHGLGNLARFPAFYLERGLILAGGGAGIAAAFNTPLAGVMFAIEEMGRSFDRRTSAVVLVAVILAGLTAISIQGNYDYFGRVQELLPLPRGWPVIPVAGVLGGLLGGAFTEFLLFGTRSLARFYERHPVRVAAAAGLVVAGVGLWSGGATWGSGYLEARALLAGEGQTPFYYFWLKLLATAASYLSGIPGGIFAPSLSTGAGLGADLAHWFSSLPREAVVLLGMVAYFSGVVQTPITAFVIVMEMSSDPGMILPLMATSLIASGTSRLICPTPIYEALARDFLGRSLAARPRYQAPEP